MFGMRVRIALAEKGVKNKSPLLLQMNPIHKKIPVLIHNGKPICESAIIVQYIDEVWNDKAPILPSDPYERAQARFWVDYIDKKVNDTWRKMWLSTGEEHETWKKEFISVFKQLEEALGDKPFYGGDTFGFVDLGLIPFYSWFYTFETYGNFKMEAECPKLVAWAKRCLQREAVSKTLPDEKKVYDHLLPNAMEEEAKVVLLGARFSMFEMRVKIALAEKGIKYEYMEQDLTNKSTLLQEMNPIHKKIPVLIHHGRPICESLIIVEYIDMVWDNNCPLLPSDPYHKAQARFWADFVDQKVYHASKRVWISKGDEKEVAKKDFLESLKQLEEFLGDKPYFGGDTFGFVDVALIPFYCWFYTYETFGNFKVEGEYPKLISWAKRCMQKESVSETLADEREVYEAVLDYKNKFILN
ncbi:Glutathione S-transferase 3 [Glycine soja]